MASRVGNNAGEQWPRRNRRGIHPSAERPDYTGDRAGGASCEHPSLHSQRTTNFVGEGCAWNLGGYGANCVLEAAFSEGVTVKRPVPRLTWLTNKPLWVDQWPLTVEKAEALQLLVQEQLRQGHLQPTTSPWNTPVFVIKKKSGQWRPLHDLRQVNAAIEDMGALQPGMPSPTMLPRNWSIVIVDLKDCFFTIPLAPEDARRFAFSVPSRNHQSPMQRYHRTVLPQGMKNSPTICQMYVAEALSEVRRKHPHIFCYHYMDDILMAGAAPELLEPVMQEATISLEKHGLRIAPEKVQSVAPWKYLGWKILDHTVEPQTVALSTDIKTLNDLQKLLGTINWVRTLLGIDNATLAPLFDLLKGDPNPRSKRTLTTEARSALTQVARKLRNRQAHRWVDNFDLQLYIFNQEKQPLGLSAQWVPEQGRAPLVIVEWIFLPYQPVKTIVTRIEMLSMLIRKGRKRAVELSGKEVHTLFLPLTAEYLEWCQANSLPLQVALEGFLGQISLHPPSHKLFTFCIETTIVQQPLCQTTPVVGQTVFTDGSGKTAMEFIKPQT
nr:PREDICTED: endogenous retrovirus group K member 11 Pol protein-like [Apteryx mantelli mantelli]